MFTPTPEAINAMVSDRSERLRRDVDRARLARSVQRRSRRPAHLLPRMLGALRAGARRVGLRPVSSWASWN